MAAISQKDIQKINRLYIELKTYAAVARATGFSASTVRKYVKKDFKLVDDSKIKHFTGSLPQLKVSSFLNIYLGDLCTLTEEEEKEMSLLWEEMEV